MEEIQKLIDVTLKDIGDFCINECKSFCCRKGYLVLKNEEVDLVIGKYKEELIKRGELKEMSVGKFSLNLNNYLGGCPQLKKLKCEIHEHENRPSTCKNFPIFILGNEIKISPRCTAKRENKFFEFIHEAEKRGYKIVEEFSCFK